MNAEVLLRYFDRISDAPDAVPRLRQFILDLAIRGKLLGQDPRDETASEANKRPGSERALSQKPKAVAKQPEDPNAARETLFTLPKNWLWTTLGAIADWGSGSTPSRTNQDLFGGGIPWLKSGELNDNRQLSGSEETITASALSAGSFRQNKAGDVLLAMYGATIGKVAILSKPAVTNQAVCGCTPSPCVSNEFLFHFLLSQRSYFHAASEGGAQPNISKAKILGFPFPLPPLAEQDRIVAKVDELMALCDRLEKAQKEREARRDRLAAASLHHLNTATDPADLRQNAHFFINHLPKLTTRPDQIKQIRQTILDLAVRGGLVPQVLHAEPASKLLARIREAKANMVRTGYVKRFAVVLPIQVEAVLMRVPFNWCWVRLGELLLGESQNGYSRKPDDAPNGIPILRISAGTSRRDGIVLEEEHKLIGGVTTAERLQYALQPGDLLACRFNGNQHFVGRLSLYLGYLGLSPIYPDKLIRFRLLSDFVIPRLIGHFAASTVVRADVESYAATTVGNWGISSSHLKEVKIPLPPLEEQHRIVERLDLLLGICDRLEEGISKNDEHDRLLLDSVLHNALFPRVPEAT